MKVLARRRVQALRPPFPPKRGGPARIPRGGSRGGSRGSRGFAWPGPRFGGGTLSGPLRTRYTPKNPPKKGGLRGGSGGVPPGGGGGGQKWGLRSNFGGSPRNFDSGGVSEGKMVLKVGSGGGTFRGTPREASGGGGPAKPLFSPSKHRNDGPA